MMAHPRIALASGDPWGVGPVICAEAARQLSGELPMVLFGDAAELGGLLGPHLPARVISPTARLEDADTSLCIVDTGRSPAMPPEGRGPAAECGAYQLRTLSCALEHVRRGGARALVTAPMSKAAVSMSGTVFTGQTEYLARACGLAYDDVSMLFLGGKLNVGLVTTHLPIRRVPDEVTRPRVVRTLVHLAQALLRMGVQAPRIVVAGLNPHAGEHGYLGHEELETIAPAVEDARHVEPFASGHARLSGLWPSESCFRWAAIGQVDGVVAMMHDQATIASKLLDWSAAVNVTWGLPILRTSVDHGVAYEARLARTVDSSAMIKAVQLAVRLAATRPDSTR